MKINSMFETCVNKQNEVIRLFSSCANEVEKYEKIIELGRDAPNWSEEEKTEESRVHGCQSALFLRSYMKEGLIFFETDSNALISSGLAALLTRVYSGESPETVIKCPPDYLEELKIGSSLTPSRANGLYNIHLKMKQEALKRFMDRMG